MDKEEQARRFLAMMKVRKWQSGAILISGELDLSGRMMGAPMYQRSMMLTEIIISRMMVK